MPFFEDRTDAAIRADIFERLLMFSNKLVAAHRVFFTVEVMAAIGEITVVDIDALERTGRPIHEVA